MCTENVTFLCDSRTITPTTLRTFSPPAPPPPTPPHFRYESNIAELTAVLDRERNERSLSDLDAARRLRELSAATAAAAETAATLLAEARASAASAEARASVAICQLSTTRADFCNLAISPELAAELAAAPPDSLSLRAWVQLRVAEIVAPLRAIATDAVRSSDAARADADAARSTANAAEIARSNAAIRASSAETRLAALGPESRALSLAEERALRAEAKVQATEILIANAEKERAEAVRAMADAQADKAALADARAAASEAEAALEVARTGAMTREAYATSLAALVTQNSRGDLHATRDAAIVEVGEAMRSSAAASAAAVAASEREAATTREALDAAVARAALLQTRLDAATVEREISLRAAAASAAASASELAELRADERTARAYATRTEAAHAEVSSSLHSTRLELDAAREKVAVLLSSIAAVEGAGAVRVAELGAALSAARSLLARQDQLEDAVDATVMAAGKEGNVGGGGDVAALPVATSSARRVAQAVALARDLCATRASLALAEAQTRALTEDVAAARLEIKQGAETLAAITGPAYYTVAAIAEARNATRVAREEAVVARRVASEASSALIASDLRASLARAEVDTLLERLAANAGEPITTPARTTANLNTTETLQTLPMGISAPPPPAFMMTSSSSSSSSSAAAALYSPPPLSSSPSFQPFVSQGGGHIYFSNVEGGREETNLRAMATSMDDMSMPLVDHVGPGGDSLPVRPYGGSPDHVVVRPLVRLREKTNMPRWYSHAPWVATPLN